MDIYSCTAVGELGGIRFGLATDQDICKASSSEFSVTHASQLANPLLGMPIESGKCATCGAAEVGQCDGHFGFIELPVPIYHPSHVAELSRLLNLLCLGCLRTRKNKLLMFGSSTIYRVLNDAPSCCQELSKVSVNELKTSDGASFLELKVPARTEICHDFWNFLKRYGYRYGRSHTRPLLPSEALEILKRIPMETRVKLSARGFFPQSGYILRYLPVPPNCLCIPEISDGICVISSDISMTLLKKVLKQVDIIRSSRSGEPNFEAHEVEVNDLQTAVMQYLNVRGASKMARGMEGCYGIDRESSRLSTKVWLEKIRTLFISKGSGFSSRSVITGDAYRGLHEIGIPFEIAQKITFEERVNVYNIVYLQKLVDERLCLYYKDGLSAFSLREGSTGHAFLRLGQVVHRRIMDGDIVFINRPPSTHKHSLQAFSVYIHEDHTVKINPFICGPLSADFDGDCVHLFYPQSLTSRAEVVELFMVDKQLLSSHNGHINLQLSADSLLSLIMLFKQFVFERAIAQQLAMFACSSLPPPVLLKTHNSGSFWTAVQVVESVLPVPLHCSEVNLFLERSKTFKYVSMRASVRSIFNEIVTLLLLQNGHEAVLKFFNNLQPLLMEYLFIEGYSIDLKDIIFSSYKLVKIQKGIQALSPFLDHLRTAYSEVIEVKLNALVRILKVDVNKFILESRLGGIVDAMNDSAMHKVVQQLGFLGMQLSEGKKFYSEALVEGMAALFISKCKFDRTSTGKYGFVSSCFVHGLNPYEEMVHSVATREVIVCSRSGLSEPGTLFKNLMAILRDVVICYDGSVRNVCSNSIIQFKYGITAEVAPNILFPAGEPVGVLAATAMSNPAYKAVLDSSPGSYSLWEMMKEILLSRVAFKNDRIDRRVILYLKRCGCGQRHCQEKAAYHVQNYLKKVNLKDVAVNFFVKYEKQEYHPEFLDASLVGHIHLNKNLLDQMYISKAEVLEKCEATINSCRKKKQAPPYLAKVSLSSSDCCDSYECLGNMSSGIPCVKFFLHDPSYGSLELSLSILSSEICPAILGTVIKGDPRICSIDVIPVVPGSTPWIKKHSKDRRCEIALDVVLDKGVVKKSGDAWRIAIDSCLPVIQLIDTERSGPYAVKEIQELLGISCAFDLAVQRLSRSVSLVSKDVLKEHLILLANSMTCCGKLIGFNIGGYKTLSRNLDIQVPFTEATLFTPKRCFERAAEKCHQDSLSSIVASCSWGKRVAVGTGSRFDLMWEDRLEEANHGDSIDVYELLNLVRDGANKKDSNTSCLGVEIDNLAPEEYMDVSLSPDYGAEIPVFDDNVEPYSVAASSGWSSPSVRVQEGKCGRSEWDKQSPSVLSNINKESLWEQKSLETSNNWDARHSKDNVEGQCDQRSEQKGIQNEEFSMPKWSNARDSLNVQMQEEKRDGSEWDRQFPSVSFDTIKEESLWGQKSFEMSYKLDGGHVMELDQKSEQEEAQHEEFSIQKPSNAWDSSYDEDGNEGGATEQWKGQISTSKNWPSTACNDRNNKRKSWPSKSPRFGDDSNVPASFTATRQRLDIFTSEEHNILSEAEQLMLSTRKIIQQTLDGNPLTEQDQLYIIDNVFAHHPNQNAKIGSGIDYITVNRHSNFQESRCFYIVSKDGNREDFSYLKCVANLLRKKYAPDLAQQFIDKYFEHSRYRSVRESQMTQEPDESWSAE